MMRDRNADIPTNAVGSQLNALPPLRTVIDQCGLKARKSLGQNFLLDLNLTRRIAREGGPLDDATIIEVGPGPGGLTRGLLSEGAVRVIAIERDERCLPALQTIAEAASHRLEIVAGDALKTDYPSLLDGSQGRIVANLPYNIATPLLVSWLTSETWPPFWRSMTLMFQREVADRIVAGPGDKAYGRLSVVTDWRSRAVRLFDIPPDAFTPKPKVVSSVVRFEPRLNATLVSPRSVARITAAAFGQRRKMLRSSLKPIWPQAAAVLEAAGIDPQARAETIPVAGFLTLAQRLESEMTSKG